MGANKSYCVYIHICKSNGKCYIGRTKNVEQRWDGNGSRYKGCHHFYNAIKKYGFDNFYHLVVEKGLTFEESVKKELEYINKYNSADVRYGYNIRSGNVDEPEISDVCEDSEIRDSVLCVERLFSKKVRCIESDTVYENIQEASKETGINEIEILKCCVGLSLYAGRYNASGKKCRWVLFGYNDIRKNRTYKTMSCVECGNKFVVDTRNMNKIRCDKCQHEYTKKLCRERKRRKLCP